MCSAPFRCFIGFMGISSLQKWSQLLPGFELRSIAPHVAPKQARLPGAAPERDAGAADATTTSPPADLCARSLREAGLVGFARAAAAAAAPLTLLINDTHRFTDTASFLAAFFAVLDSELARCEQPHLRVLVAAGSHISSVDERREHEQAKIGRWRGRIAELAWHDARDPACLAAVGSLRLHRWMSEGGFYLACGSMEPHYFAGVTGAHKTLTVGLMSMEDLQANHAQAMAPEASGLRLQGNPVYESIVAALGELELSGAKLLALNQVIVDEQVRACTAGAPLEALERGLPLLHACCSVALPQPLDLVVAQVEPPLDRDFYQADKGIKNCEAAVRDGGVIIVEASCEGGVGIDHFVELLRRAPSHEAALAVVASRGYRLGDHKAVRLRALTDTRGVHVGLLSRGLQPSLAGVLGISIFTDRSAAAAWAVDLLAAGPGMAGGAGPAPSASVDEAKPALRGAVVADAGNICLQLRPAAPPR